MHSKLIEAIQDDDVDLVRRIIERYLETGNINELRRLCDGDSSPLYKAVMRPIPNNSLIEKFFDLGVFPNMEKSEDVTFISLYISRLYIYSYKMYGTEGANAILKEKMDRLPDIIRSQVQRHVDRIKLKTDILEYLHQKALLSCKMSQEIGPGHHPVRMSSKRPLRWSA